MVKSGLKQVFYRGLKILELGSGVKLFMFWLEYRTRARLTGNRLKQKRW
jgi:hypothetical protein